jgi:hypothetical protein
MRLRTQAGFSGALACVSLFYLSFAVGWSQSSSPSNRAEPASGERSSKAPEVLLTPQVLAAQQLQEQHQQLLKAVELIRQDTQIHLQRYVTAMERIRKDTDTSLKRFTATVDGKLERLNRTVAAEREHSLQTLRDSNQFALKSASIIVGLLLLEILFLAWLSMRAVNRLATRMSTWNSERASFPGTVGTVGLDAAHPLTGNLLEETNLRLQNAIEHLEQRLLDLEHTSNRVQATLTSPASPVTIAPAHFGSSALPAKPGKASGVSLSIGQGESLIFLPHEREIAPLRAYQSFLQKVRKRLQPARIAKSH